MLCLRSVTAVAFPFMSRQLCEHSAKIVLKQECGRAGWIQFCSLSNVFRVHSDPFNDRRPWSFGNATGNATHDPTEAIFRNFSHMRLQMLPMLSSAAAQVKSHDLEALPMLLIDMITA